MIFLHYFLLSMCTIKNLNKLLQKKSYNIELFEIDEFDSVDVDLRFDIDNKDIYDSISKQNSILVNLNLVYSYITHVTVKKVVFKITDAKSCNKPSEISQPYFVLTGSLLLDKSIIPLISSYKIYICFNHDALKVVSSKVYKYDVEKERLIEDECEALLKIIRIRPLIKKIISVATMEHNFRGKLCTIGHHNYTDDSTYNEIFYIILNSLSVQRVVDSKNVKRSVDSLMENFFHSLVSNFNSNFLNESFFIENSNIQNNINSLLFHKDEHLQSCIMKILDMSMNSEFYDKIKDNVEQYEDNILPRFSYSDSYEDFESKVSTDIENRKDYLFFTENIRQNLVAKNENNLRKEILNIPETDDESSNCHRRESFSENCNRSGPRNSFRRDKNEGGLNTMKQGNTGMNSLPRRNSRINLFRGGSRSSLLFNNECRGSSSRLSENSLFIDDKKDVDDMVSINLLSKQRNFFGRRDSISMQNETVVSKKMPSCIKEVREQENENYLDDFTISIKDMSEFKKFLVQNIDIFEKALYEILVGLKKTKRTNLKEIQTIFFKLATVQKYDKKNEEGITMLFKNKSRYYFKQPKKQCIFGIVNDGDNDFILTSFKNPFNFYTAGCCEDYLYVSMKTEVFEGLEKIFTAIFYFESCEDQVSFRKIKSSQDRVYARFKNFI